jgi:undecaprenyl-diphosphatase
MDGTVQEYLQTALLALIQGAAELLPVSSSAHVIFAEKLMGIDPSSPKATFLLVMLHTGTMGAVLVYFWPRWKGLLVAPGPAAGGNNLSSSPLPGDAISLSPASGPRLSAVRFLALVVVATAVTGAVGLGLKLFIERVVMERWLGHEKGEVEHLFKELGLVSAALFAVGLVIIAASFFERRALAQTLSTPATLLIGLVQGLCLPFRGFSRSGATISTAFFCGVSRQLAEDFSFALAVALTPAAIALELYRLVKDPTFDRGNVPHMLAPGLVGMVLSFLAGLVALRLLSAALERGRWRYFGVYCLVASVVLFAYARMTPP